LKASFFPLRGFFFKTTFFLAVPRQTPPEAKRFFLPEAIERNPAGLISEMRKA
jgi:hypothetical protein